jgi:hypothetical protein
MTWKKLALALVALALVASGCGSKSKSTSSEGSAAPAETSTTSASQTHFAKTKFVFHAALAFGAFHHFIYKPLRAGELSHPLSHKLKAVKAALATLFVVHELKLALADAKADPLLSKIVAPLTALQEKLTGLVSGIKSGHPDAAALESANGSIGAIHGLAAKAGQPITEQIPATP